MYTYFSTTILSHSHTISRGFSCIFRRIIFYPCHTDARLALILAVCVCVSHKRASFCVCVWESESSFFFFFFRWLFAPSHTFSCSLSLIHVCFRCYCSGKQQQQKCYSTLVNIFDLRWYTFFFSLSRRNIIGVSCCYLRFFVSRRFFSRHFLPMSLSTSVLLQKRQKAATTTKRCYRK